MPTPRRFDGETRARAVRLYADRLRDHGESKLAARKHVGELLDMNPATLRNWIEADERAARPASAGGEDSAGDMAAELRQLRQEVAELRRANDILETASAFFAQAELDVDSSKDLLHPRLSAPFRIEPICAVLSEHGRTIAPQTYYRWLTCPVRPAELEEAYLVNEIVDLYRRNKSVYGVRKLWHAGLRVGRDQVGRLMRIACVQGVRRGEHRTTTTTRDGRARDTRTWSSAAGRPRTGRTPSGSPTSPTCGPPAASATCRSSHPARTTGHRVPASAAG
jgi:transposase